MKRVVVNLHSNLARPQEQLASLNFHEGTVHNESLKLLESASMSETDPGHANQ
jgi:hypothetical protein